MTLQIVRAPAVTEALVEQDETQCDAPAATTQAFAPSPQRPDLPS